MSTTLDREVAFNYAKGSKVSTILEVRMGMVDRGADVHWLSQYPLEREILFAPLSGLEVQGSRIADSTLLINIKLAVHLRDRTIEEVLAKMRTSHVQLIDMLLEEMSVVGAPRRARKLFTSLERGWT